MQQAAPRRHGDIGMPHKTRRLRIICTEQEAQPGNKEGDQRICPMCLPSLSSGFHSLVGTQPEAATGNLTTLKACAIQSVDAA